MFPSTQTKISDHLSQAEQKLEASGYTVVRHVRISQRLRGGKVFRLSVWGETFRHLAKVSLTVGDGYKLLLNAKEQEILIQ